MNLFTKILSSTVLIATTYVATPTGCTQEITSEFSNVASALEELDKKNSENSVHEAEKSIETSRSSNNERLIEIPGKISGRPERIIKHYAYTLSFNREHNQPNWVAWELSSKETSGHLDRSNDFQADPMIPSPHQVTTNDYKGSGYDRGHMAPAADMKWSPVAMRECFYMSNMCPQEHKLNSGAWSSLEKACRRWAQKEDRIYIVCGPIFKNKKNKTIGKDIKITIPDGFFKVVLSMKKGKEKAIGFYYNNRGSKQNMSNAATTVDHIEAMTGIDFFVNIPDKLEERIEAEYSLSEWN